MFLLSLKNKPPGRKGRERHCYDAGSWSEKCMCRMQMWELLCHQRKEKKKPKQYLSLSCKDRSSVFLLWAETITSVSTYGTSEKSRFVNLTATMTTRIVRGRTKNHMLITTRPIHLVCCHLHTWMDMLMHVSPTGAWTCSVSSKRAACWRTDNESDWIQNLFPSCFMLLTRRGLAAHDPGKLKRD